jgi:hypothetical protein
VSPTSRLMEGFSPHNLQESKSLFQLGMFWNVQGHQNVYSTLFSSVTHGAQSLLFNSRAFDWFGMGICRSYWRATTLGRKYLI